MKTTIIILYTFICVLCISTVPLNAQIESGTQEALIDLDEDGIIDTLKINTEYGSAGDIYYTSTITSSGKDFLMKVTCPVSSFISMVKIRCADTNRDLFMSKSLELLFGAQREIQSLGMSFLLSIKKSEKDSNIRRYIPKWVADTTGEFRSCYSMENISNNIYQFDWEIEDGIKWDDIRVYYNPYFHQLNDGYSINFSNEIRLFVTMQGVAVIQNGLYSWCFISDGRVMGLEKLYWPTISSVFYLEEVDKIIIVQDIPPTEIQHIYEVDYHQGIIREVYSDYVSNTITDIRIENDSIYIISEDNELTKFYSTPSFSSSTDEK